MGLVVVWGGKILSLNWLVMACDLSNRGAPLLLLQSKTTNASKAKLIIPTYMSGGHPSVVTLFLAMQKVLGSIFN